MRKSIWWFRTRKDKGIYRSLLSLKPKKGYAAFCECDLCGEEFNRTELDIGFEHCRSCRTADRNRSKKARERSSKTFKKYYATEENRNKASKLAKDRYANSQYAKYHRGRCKERSADPAYREKLSDSIDPVVISCGLRGISIEEFDGF